MSNNAERKCRLDKVAENVRKPNLAHSYLEVVVTIWDEVMYLFTIAACGAASLYG
jgi:hypothetical protein